MGYILNTRREMTVELCSFDSRVRNSVEEYLTLARDVECYTKCMEANEEVTCDPDGLMVSGWVSVLTAMSTLLPCWMTVL